MNEFKNATKETLLKELEKLRIKKVNGFTADFKGVCGNPHRINTNPKNLDIKPGQFFDRGYYKNIDSEYESHEIILIVGIGKGCPKQKKMSIWFLREDDKRGLFCTSSGTTQELNEIPLKFKWKIV